jgi:hypothetical protein
MTSAEILQKEVNDLFEQWRQADEAFLLAHYQLNEAKNKRDTLYYEARQRICALSALRIDSDVVINPHDSTKLSLRILWEENIPEEKDSA